MRLFTACYTLPNGQRRELLLVARSSAAAIVQLLDTVGAVRRCSVRPA